jgi:hypothetical protein
MQGEYGEIFYGADCQSVKLSEKQLVLCGCAMALCPYDAIMLTCILFFGLYFQAVTAEQLNNLNLSAFSQTRQQIYGSAQSAFVTAMHVQLNNVVARHYNSTGDIALTERRNIVNALSCLVVSNSNIHSIYLWYTMQA